MKVFINFVMGVWKIIFFEVFSCWVNMVSFLRYVFCCYFFFMDWILVFYLFFKS